MKIWNRVACAVLGSLAALVLVACNGQAPLAPSSVLPGIAGSSTASSGLGVLAPAGSGSSNAGDRGGHDVNDDHGRDAAGHDVNDDHGRDGAGHDVNDDRGRDADDDNAQRDSGEVTGAIAGLNGQCPDLTFTIGTVTVMTSAATTFRDAACRDLTNGMTVEAKGTSAGAALSATDVQRKR